MPLPRSLCNSLDVPRRWPLTPESLGLCTCEPLPLSLAPLEPEPAAPPACDQACGAMTSTAPLNTRLDKTFFFIETS
jgi:hypothetical protein